MASPPPSVAQCTSVFPSDCRSSTRGCSKLCFEFVNVLGVHIKPLVHLLRGSP